MKKYLLSAIVIIAFTAYSFHLHSEEGETPKVLAPVGLTTPASPEMDLDDDDNHTVTPPVSTQIQTSGPAPTTVAGKFKDGQYTGVVADAYYGNIQVRATISQGKLSDVQFLQYPNDRHTSIEINTQAMPFLRSEAIQIQNAQVDIISGATDTSRAFRTSLASALSQAR